MVDTPTNNIFISLVPHSDIASREKGISWTAAQAQFAYLKKVLRDPKFFWTQYFLDLDLEFFRQFLTSESSF